MKRKAQELPGRARGTREEPASRFHVCVSDDSGNWRAIPLDAPLFSHGAWRRMGDVSKLTGDQAWETHRDASWVALKLCV